MGNLSGSSIYIGVTNNLERRVAEHKSHNIGGFTEHYNCHKLLYFEDTPSVNVAIEREKQLKKWSRGKKEALIDSMNPNRTDLSTSVEMTE
jgi:predicted GIY-YIG superfamily endonuclease